MPSTDMPSDSGLGGSCGQGVREMRKRRLPLRRWVHERVYQSMLQLLWLLLLL